MKFDISVSEELKSAAPQYAGAAVYAAVKNTPHSEGLWEEIAAFTRELTATTRMEDIKLQPVIAATREAYKRWARTPDATVPLPKRCVAD